MGRKNIELALRVEPRKLTMAQRRNLRISLNATNTGGEMVDPRLHEARLFVNGTESKVWSLAIGNGRREAKWYALPPGETVSMTWSSMGESLLVGPGVFALQLQFGEIQLAPIHVHVLPEES